jgi:hypothetical protein
MSCVILMNSHCAFRSLWGNQGAIRGKDKPAALILVVSVQGDLERSLGHIGVEFDELSVSLASSDQNLIIGLSKKGL